MSHLNRRTVLAATGALGASVVLPRVYAQSVPELQTLRSTSKAWLWADRFNSELMTTND